MAKGKVLFVIASEGYHPIEFGTPKKILEKEDYEVLVASNKSVPAIAKDGSTTDVDVLVSDINPADYDAIFFIGGPGAIENLDNAESYRVVKEAIEKKMPLGAICISPHILAKAGALTGKKATGWDGHGELEAFFKEYGVTYKREPVVVDEYIITATGPSAAEAFGKEIVKVLKKIK